MSIRAMSEVWSINLPDSQKIVLLALADCANDEGICWPSIASLTRKCSKGERTIQGVIIQLVEAGHLSRVEVIGKGCRYVVHPRKDCAPVAAKKEPSPPQPLPPADSAPPQGLPLTPAAAADKPSRTINKHTETRARKIPDDWRPADFGIRTKSRAIIDGWTADELDGHLEHFTAHHRGKGSRFVDWQDAWSTWVLNNRKFGGNRNGNSPNRNGHGQNPDRRSTLARAIDDGIDNLDWMQRNGP